MFCTKCGKQIKDNIKYCTSCGAAIKNVNVLQNDNAGSEGAEKKKKERESHKSGPVIPILIAVIVILLAIVLVFGFVIYKHGSNGDDSQTVSTEENTSTDNEGENNSEVISSEISGENDVSNDTTTDETTDATATETDNNTTAESDDVSPDDNESDDIVASDDIESEHAVLMSRMGIDENTYEDYFHAKFYTEYKYYSTGREKFNFYYPINIYNNVECYSYRDGEGHRNEYGEELDYVRFSGSQNGFLEYRLSRRDDYLSIESILESILFNETNKLEDAYVISNKIVEDEGYGRIIVTGYYPGTEMVAYIVATVNDWAVYEMKLYTPPYQDEMDRLYKQYETECCYRMCDFCFASDSARTFDEFCAEYR